MEVDMETFYTTILPLIKDKIKNVDTEVVYLIVFLHEKDCIPNALEVAKVCKEQGKIVVAVIAMPYFDDIDFMFEANNAFLLLKPFVDTSLVFYRDFFEMENPEMFKEFSPRDLLTMTFEIPFIAINKIINQKGEIVVNESDVKTWLKSGAFAAVGIGESNLPNRISIMVNQVLGSPFLQFLNKERCKLILLNIEASVHNAIRDDEIEELNHLLHQNFDKEVDIILGLKNNNSLSDMAKLQCLFSFSEHEQLF